MNLFLGDVSGFSVVELRDWIAKEFIIDRASLDKYDFLVAQLNDDCYSSDCYFLFKDYESGSFYEIDASHCSCYGYEEEWEPRLAPKAYLLSDLYKPHDKDVQKFVRSLFN